MSRRAFSGGRPEISLSKLMKPLLILFFTTWLALASPTLLGAVRTSAAKATTNLDAEGPWRQALERAQQRWQAFRKETPLTGEQKARIREIVQPHHAEIRQQLSALRDAHRQLREASKNNGDLAAAADKVGDAARRGALLRAQLTREIRPVLTPEQRRRLDSALAEFERGTDRLGNLR